MNSCPKCGSPIEENATSEDEEKVVPVNLVYRTKKGEKKQKPHQVKLNIPMKFAVGGGIHEGDYEAILTLRKEKDEDGNRKLDITFKKK